MSKKTKNAYCPSCDTSLNIQSSVRLYQKFLCKSCRTELEVVELNPLTLDWVFDYEDTADDPYTDHDDLYLHDDYSSNRY